MHGCLLHAPMGDLAHNTSTCPDWESNPQHFGSQASTQSTEPHQPGIKIVLNSSILMPFSASATFCFTSFILAKCFPLRTFITQGNKKKSCLGQDQVNREGGAWRSCHFWSKTAEHSARCEQVHL